MIFLSLDSSPSISDVQLETCISVIHQFFSLNAFRIRLYPFLPV